MAEELNAIKHDAEKPQMSLLDADWLEGVATVLTFGARKYDRHNWRNGFIWSRLYDSLQRHLNAFWSGEEIDQESGSHHLLHAACCLMFLWWHVRFGKGKDDRYITAHSIPSEPVQESEGLIASEEVPTALLKLSRADLRSFQGGENLR